LDAVLANKPDDEIWRQVYYAVTEPTPPPRPIASSFYQTPWLNNTSSFANSSEYRKNVDIVLRDELGAMYVGLPRFHEIFFGRVAGLETASEAVFKKCMEGSEPLFDNGWSGWPTDANQDGVLTWFAEMSENTNRPQHGDDGRWHNPTSRSRAPRRNANWTSASWMTQRLEKILDVTGRMSSYRAS
jgi:hypothetical protein